MKTIIEVKNHQYNNEKPLSRSHAKALLKKLKDFDLLVFDFDGVILIGQAFADEIFRVFASNNSDVHLMPINMNNDVKFMVHRAINLKESQADELILAGIFV